MLLNRMVPVFNISSHYQYQQFFIPKKRWVKTAVFLGMVAIAAPNSWSLGQKNGPLHVMLAKIEILRDGSSTTHGLDFFHGFFFHRGKKSSNKNMGTNHGVISRSYFGQPFFFWVTSPRHHRPKGWMAMAPHLFCGTSKTWCSWWTKAIFVQMFFFFL